MCSYLDIGNGVEKTLHQTRSVLHGRDEEFVLDVAFFVKNTIDRRNDACRTRAEHFQQLKKKEMN